MLNLFGSFFKKQHNNNILGSLDLCVGVLKYNLNGSLTCLQLEFSLEKS